MKLLNRDEVLKQAAFQVGLLSAFKLNASILGICDVLHRVSALSASAQCTTLAYRSTFLLQWQCYLFLLLFWASYFLVYGVLLADPNSLQAAVSPFGGTKLKIAQAEVPGAGVG